MDNIELKTPHPDADERPEPAFKSINSKAAFFLSSLKNKFRYAILGAAFILALLLLFVSYFILKNYLKKENYDNMKAFSQYKAQQIDQYFSQLDNQIALACKDARLKEAFDELTEAFGGIESDSYILPEFPGLSSITLELEGFYTSEMSPLLAAKSGKNINPLELIPDGDKARILQFLYIANNNATFGFKNKMQKAGDASAYSGAHQKYHAFFRELISGIGISDILLIDGINGDIVYTYQKNIDFGTNIHSGPYKGSNLAIAYQKALSGSDFSRPSHSDFGLYAPVFYQPVSFIALAFTGYSGKKGVIVIQLKADNLDKILMGGEGNKANKFIQTGGNIYLVGEDFEYLTNDSRIKFASDIFIKKLVNSDISKQTVVQIDSLKTTVKLLAINHTIFENALLGYQGVARFRDVAGYRVFAYINPISTNAGEWFLVVQREIKNVFKTANRLLFWSLCILIILGLMIIYLTGRFSKKISESFERIRTGLQIILSGGQADDKNVPDDDDLGMVNMLVNDLSLRIKAASDFALELSTGNMNAEFRPGGERDLFANALNKLKESLIYARKEEEKRKIEDEIRNWTTQGIAKFNDLLRHENDNIIKFTYLIINNMVEYLNANQGSIFLLEGENNEEKVLNLTAAVAWDRQKFINKQIKVGEGLVGQVVLEKKSMFLKDIPDDFVTITSGLGDANPRSLMIVPMLYNGEVTGVFEIASFNEFKSFEIEFVEKIAESTAITLNSVRLNVRTKLLLEESNERAEELAAQEEEMRQNLEELKATQEEMTRVKEESSQKDAQQREQQKALLEQMKKNNEELQQKATLLEWEKLMFNKLMDNIPARITYKDTESRYIRINKAKVKALGIKNQDEVMGKTDFDIFGAAHGQKALDTEKQMIRSGVSVENKEELIRFKDGRVTWGSTSRIPLIDDDGNIKGGLVITWDITEMKNCQFRLEVNNKLIHNLVSGLPMLYYCIDQKGSIVFFRGKGLDLLQLKEDELTGKSFYKMYPELKPILEIELGDDGYSFVQQTGDHEFRHIIFTNKTTQGGFSGLAFEVNVS